MKRKFIMGLMILSCVGCLLTGCGDDGETKESQGANSSHSSQTVQEQTSESTTSENTASENATSEETSESIDTGSVGATSEPQETPKPVVTVIPAQSSVTTPTVSNNTTEQTKPETSEEDADDEEESNNSESDTSESEDTNTPTDAEEEDNDEPEKESDNDDDDEEQPVNNNAWRNTVLTYTVDKDAWVIHKTNCSNIDVNADMQTVRSRLTYLISANVHPETGEHLTACPNCLPDDTTHGDYDWERQVTRYVVDTDNMKIHEYNCECTLGTHQTVKSSISYLELHNVLFRCSVCFGNGSGSDSNNSDNDSNNSDSDNDSDNRPSSGGSGLSGNVWISKYGNTYHSHNGCEYLKENGVECITRESAEEKAFTPCEHCY